MNNKQHALKTKTIADALGVVRDRLAGGDADAVQGAINHIVKLGADNVWMAKACRRAKDAAHVVTETMRDEGGRVYFNKTSDADTLREAFQALDDIGWDRMMERYERDENLYQKLRDSRKRIEELEAALQSTASLIALVMTRRGDA